MPPGWLGEPPAKLWRSANSGKNVGNETPANPMTDGDAVAGRLATADLLVLEFQAWIRDHPEDEPTVEAAAAAIGIGRRDWSVAAAPPPARARTNCFNSSAPSAPRICAAPLLLATSRSRHGWATGTARPCERCFAVTSPPLETSAVRPARSTSCPGALVALDRRAPRAPRDHARRAGISASGICSRDRSGCAVWGGGGGCRGMSSRAQGPRPLLQRRGLDTHPDLSKLAVRISSHRPVFGLGRLPAYVEELAAHCQDRGNIRPSPERSTRVERCA